MFPQIFGKYVLERELAAGGMARVFLATLRGAGGFEKRLVVKQIRPELASDQSFIGRFVAEAKTTVELSHSNIVPVYELGAERGTYYIAMEYCEGASLNQLLAAGPLSPAEGAYIGVEICRALDYAHRKAGIVHRDVTPRNVMIDAEGMVRLIDFGIAASARVQTPGKEPLFGSPGHMPPEQLRPGPLTPAADVFAVAVLLIETWTGKPPFRRESFEASLAALEQTPPDVADSVIELAPLSDLLRAALSLEAQARPQSAEDFARPLREFLRQSDLGDIARRLGRRVSELADRQAEADAPHTWVESVPAPAAGATQTFAVREAVREWTGRIDSQPPRISQTAPLPDALASDRFSEPALAPAARRSRRLAAPALLGWALGLGLTSAWVMSREAERPAAPQPARALAVVDAANALAAPPPVEPGGSELALASVSAPAPAAPEPAPVRAAVVSARERKAPPGVVPGRFDLTADPPARIELDGISIGRTPLRGFALTPGRHELVFASDVLGEKLSTRVDVTPAEVRRVHADFTSATPQLYLR